MVHKVSKKHTCLTNNYIYWWTDNIYQSKNNCTIQLNVCYNIKHDTIHFKHGKLSKIVSQHACHNYIVLIFSLCMSKIYQPNLHRYTSGTWLYTIYIIDFNFFIFPQSQNSDIYIFRITSCTLNIQMPP